MLNAAQLEKIRSLLEQSARPFFLYDNDADGLCSFLLLRRFLGRGEGSPVRSHPDLDLKYAHQALMYGADLVVVLDRPFLGESFLSELEKQHIPVLWIDHHEVMARDREHALVHAFNPLLSGKKSNEPVTHWCYQLTKQANDKWIAVLGCIADHYLPSYAKSMAKEYPDLWKTVRKPFDAYYKSQLGFFARALGMGLRDIPSHITYLVNFMILCKSPHDLLVELDSESSFALTVRRLVARHDALMKHALALGDSKSIFFEYSGESSMSSELANELSFHYPKRYVAVAYLKEGITNISLRGPNVQKLVLKILQEFPHASGGGHKNAVGMRVPSSELTRVKERFAQLAGSK